MVLPSTPICTAFSPHNISNTISCFYSPLLLPPPSVTIFQVFTEENSAECSSAGDSGAEHQVPKLSLLEVVHIRTISASGDLISLQQEDEKFSKQLEKGKVRW